MIVWLNDGLIEAAAARIDPGDRGLLLGDGLFETIGVRDGGPRLWPAHAARLAAGAATLGLPLPRVDLPAAIGAVLDANALRDAAVRLTLTRGAGPRGVAPPEPCTPTLLITAAPLASTPPKPLALCIARFTCRNERSPLSRLKTLNYLDAVIARREALARGFDDAVMLNTRGRGTEATAANLLALIDGHWVTPPVEEGALPGVIRGELLAVGFAAEAAMTAAALFEADEMLLTNSLGVTPVIRCEDRVLTVGEGAATAQRLFERF